MSDGQIGCNLFWNFAVIPRCTHASELYMALVNSLYLDTCYGNNRTHKIPISQCDGACRGLGHQMELSAVLNGQHAGLHVSQHAGSRARLNKRATCDDGLRTSDKHLHQKKKHSG